MELIYVYTYMYGFHVQDQQMSVQQIALWNQHAAMEKHLLCHGISIVQKRVVRQQLFHISFP